MIESKREYFLAECYDPLLWAFLWNVGLRRTKSRELGALSIPSEFLTDTIRGLLDGDGSVMSTVWAPLGVANPYRLLRLRVVFYSGSRVHLDWLRGVLVSFGTSSSIYQDRRPGHESFRLELGARQSRTLLNTIYADSTAPRLNRKFRVWETYLRQRISST